MANAPLTPSEIERERFALEMAIRKIESNLRHPGTGVSPPYSGAAIERFDEGAAPPPDVGQGLWEQLELDNNLAAEHDQPRSNLGEGGGTL